jgi:hypothetical protein
MSIGLMSLGWYVRRQRSRCRAWTGLFGRGEHPAAASLSSRPRGVHRRSDRDATGTAPALALRSFYRDTEDLEAQRRWVESGES